MANIFEMRFDPREAIARIEALKAAGPKAIARGLNRTASSEKVAMSREISTDMGLKVGRVKDEIRVDKALPLPDRLRARLIVKGARIPLIDFMARGPEPSRGRGRGVSARFPGGKGRYPRAFIATMRNGHRGVFERVPTEGTVKGKRAKRARGTVKGARAKRAPIYELFGPSIVLVFQKVIPVGQSRRAEVLFKNVQHEIQFAISQSK